MSEVIKILMADDEEIILDIMAKKVADAGYTVFKAKDGAQAWDLIVKEDPDIVILDLTMPVMDGWEVLTRLRTNPPTKKWQPVIIISAHSELTTVRKGFQHDADHYLTKPCRMEDVLKGIRLMISLIPLRNN